MKQGGSKSSMDNLSYSPSSSEYLDADEELRKSVYFTPYPSQQQLPSTSNLKISDTSEISDHCSHRSSKSSLSGHCVENEEEESETETTKDATVLSQLQDEEQKTISESSVAIELTQKSSLPRHSGELYASSIEEQDDVEEKILETVSKDFIYFHQVPFFAAPTLLVKTEI